MCLYVLHKNQLEAFAMTAKNRQSITDAEMSVLKLLWSGGPFTVRSIAEGIYESCQEAEVGAVHSLLHRLGKKGFVHRDRTGHAHEFSAAVSQTDVAGMELQNAAEKVADGSLAPFLTHLIEGRRLSKEELTELRDLLEKSGKQRGGRKR